MNAVSIMHTIQILILILIFNLIFFSSVCLCVAGDGVRVKSLRLACDGFGRSG